MESLLRFKDEEPDNLSLPKLTYKYHIVQTKALLMSRRLQSSRGKINNDNDAVASTDVQTYSKFPKVN